MKRREFLKATSMASVGLASSSVADAQHNDVLSNRASVLRVLEDWRDGKGSALLDLLSDDIRWTIVGRSAVAGTTIGKKSLQEKVLQPFGARFSASSEKFKPIRIHRVLVDGDVVAAYFDARGVTNKGLVYQNSYAWFLRFEGRLASEVTAFFDSIAFNELWAESMG